MPHGQIEGVVEARAVLAGGAVDLFILRLDVFPLAAGQESLEFFAHGISFLRCDAACIKSDT